MQIDFHHAVTYVLARIAGFTHDEAKTIAHAAQYVDDAKTPGTITFSNKKTFERIASAHPVMPTGWEFFDNLKNRLNVEVWLTFHFLPGNCGLKEGEGKDIEAIRRLICTTDSHVAEAMCKACIDTKGQPNTLHRLGVTAHVYADTWAHQGFVGLKHHINDVKELHDADGQEKVGEEIQSGFAHILPLGHGMALTLPDQPYLKWELVNRDDHIDARDNTEAFIQACERIVEFFGYYLGKGETAHISPMDRAVLLTALTGIRHTDGDKRHQAWLALLSRGCFSFGPLTDQEMANLNYVPKGVGSWKHAALGTEKEGDEDGPFQWTPEFETSDWKHFHEALKEHREEVLNRILPRFGLNVEDALQA